MQIQRYLLKNRITAVINEQGIATEYKPVYQRNVTVYKGIDNKLQFKLINQDQKPIDTSLYVLWSQSLKPSRRDPKRWD